MEESGAAELQEMDEMGVWKLVDKPENVHALGLKWVFEFKQLHKNSRPVKFKEGLVAQGFRQLEGINYDKTFAPTACVASLRFLLKLAEHLGWLFISLTSLPHTYTAKLKRKCTSNYHPVAWMKQERRIKSWRL